MQHSLVTIDDVQRRYAWFEQMRTQEPVWLDEQSGAFHVFRYAEVERVISDFTRMPNRHLAFGHGIHFCIGAPLARMEAAVALPMILQQLPNIHVIREKPLELLEGEFVFGLKHLPVQFDTEQIKALSQQV